MILEREHLDWDDGDFPSLCPVSTDRFAAGFDRDPIINDWTNPLLSGCSQSGGMQIYINLFSPTHAFVFWSRHLLKLRK